MIMSKILLSDGSGRWFEEDDSQRFEERLNKGETHELLYRTRGGSYVLNTWSQKPGAEIEDDTYRMIDTETAASWFVGQGYPKDEIPEDALLPEDEI